MTKIPSDLPSQGVVFLAAMERQQRDWQTFSRALVKGPLERDLLRITDAIEMERKRGDLTLRALAKSPGMMAFESMVRATELHRQRLAEIGRAVGASAIVKEIGRMGLVFSESNIGRECRRIAVGLQAQQERALKTQRLVSRSPAFQALEQINRVTELHQRQMKSIVRAAGSSPIANAIKNMRLAFSDSAFAKDLGRITDAARVVQTQANVARCTLGSSIDFSPLEHVGASLLRGLRQSLTAAAASGDNAATANSPRAVGAVSKETDFEWGLEVFLAGLPAYFEPPENPLPKLRVH